MRRTALETRQSLVEALLALLDEQPADAISVRDVAARAGVNHGMVHRHFGSKADLLRAALVQVSGDLQRNAPDAGRGTRAFRAFRAHPQWARLLARICLDGPKDVLPDLAPEDLQATQAAVAGNIALLGLDDPKDATVINAAGVATLLGWFVFRPLLEAAYELPEDADARLDAMVAKIDALLSR